METGKTIRTLYIPVEGSPSLISIIRDLKALQEKVGGYIESVLVGKNVLYVDEEGKIKQKPENQWATAFCRIHGSLFIDDCISGDAVLVGPTDEDGNDTDLPEEFIKEFFTEEFQKKLIN